MATGSWRGAVGIAVGALVTDQDDACHLGAMWVAVDQRGTSVATELVEAICGWTSQQGAKLVTLWVADGNPRARRFYERLGFHATGCRQSLRSASEVGKEQMQRHVGD